jgi:hypothetical protein
VVSQKVPPFAVEVGGILLPKPVSGHPALELCNTVAGWDDPHRKEWLTTPAHLAIWASFTGLAKNPAVDDTALAELRELREAAYRLLRHRDDTAFPTLARYANDANAHTALTRADDGSVSFTLMRDHPLPSPSSTCSAGRSGTPYVPAQARAAAGCSSTRVAAGCGAAWRPAATA